MVASLAHASRVRPGERTGRAALAPAALGPVRHLLGSPYTARVLDLLAAESARRFKLGEVLARTGGAKGTVQASLKVLERAEMVRREGSGSHTTYRFAADEELGRRMLSVIEASRKAATTAAPPAIPWLGQFLREAPREPIRRPFGDRVEKLPTEEGAARALADAAPIPGAGQQRRRPGLTTRR